MKHLSFVFVVFILFVAVACKKETSTPVSLTTTSPTWGLNKNWQMWGHQATHYHPSNGAQMPSEYDTIINSTMTIIVIDDTTVVFRGDTLSQFAINNNPVYIEYIPKIFKDIGTRYRRTFLKYYHDVDSVSYLWEDSGVSFHDSLILYTK